MRVALVSPYAMDVPGGVQSHVAHLATELRRLGDEVLVVAPGTGPAQHGSDDVRRVGAVVRIPFNDSVAPITLSPAAATRTLRALRAFAPNVVHVHEPAVPVVALAASLRSPCPAVGTFHAWSDRDRAYRLARPVARRAAEALDARIAVSQAAVAYHAGALGLPEGAFRQIPNAVDVARFADAAPLEDLAPDGEPVLLFVGRLEPRKGLEQLVRALIILKSQRPRVRLVVVGEGPQREQAETLLPSRLQASVEFRGRVGDDELARLYRSCDCFVSPALGGESFGIVLLEAMAAGCPVVATDIPGYRSVVRDGVNGRLVPPGDPQALADAIETLLANPSLRAAMAREAATAAGRYDWPTVAAEIRRVYASVTR